MQKQFLAFVAEQILMDRIFGGSMFKVSAGSEPLHFLCPESKAEAIENAA